MSDYRFQHDPTPQQLEDELRDAGHTPRATKMRARYELGQASSEALTELQQEPSPLTIQNLRSLKNRVPLDDALFRILDDLRNEGNRAYHEGECRSLTEAEAQDYAARVKEAVEKMRAEI